ncbi:MAG: N-acetylmuramoyl-L-alanine amidase [Thiohalomonadaceae bacterium]
MHPFKRKEDFGFSSQRRAALGTLAGLLLLPVVPRVLAAGGVQVNGVRMWPSPESTRLVFDLSAPVEHTLFTLANPERVVIDITAATLSRSLAGLDYSQGLLKGIRTARQENDVLRVVLDLKQKVRPKSFVLRPNAEYGDRLVIDLEDPTAKTAPAHHVDKGDARALRDIVIALDPGHGGEDPGALGPTGTREKDVVLAVARRLKALIEQEPGMRCYMTRDGDYYVSLKQRIRKARSQRADLFISIHADAFRDRRARGASVYTLSQRGASSEYAAILADKENASDVIGGVSLDDKDDLLASVLLDLSQTATLDASSDAAARVLGSLRKVGSVHKPRVEQAGFQVLKAPDMPSVLVETAFISNPQEERQLRSSSHQYAIAKALMEGIRAYFHNNPPPGTRLARARAREHVIARGDTLSGIARSYDVSLENLRRVNQLPTDDLRVGMVLRIPSS